MSADVDGFGFQITNTRNVFGEADLTRWRASNGGMVQVKWDTAKTVGKTRVPIECLYYTGPTDRGTTTSFWLFAVPSWANRIAVSNNLIADEAVRLIDEYAADDNFQLEFETLAVILPSGELELWLKQAFKNIKGP